MVTVIVPVHNNQQFVAQALDSILSDQPGIDLEVIAVNDGSTDLTAAILDAYAQKDERVSVITMPGHGPGAARNAALDRARGEYLLFLDGDDMLLPGAISALMEMMTEDVQIVAGGFIRSHLLPDASRLNATNASRSITGHQALVMMCYQRQFRSSTCGLLYRRSAIGNLRFTEGIYYEDMEFLTRLLPTISKMALTRRDVMFYRINPGSITSVWSTRRLDVLDVTAALEARAEAAGDAELLAAARERAFSANFNMFLLCRREGLTAQAAKCWAQIVRLRGYSLHNSRVRIKNRLGALVSYFGPGISYLIGRIIS